jgi:methyl-accepting chemotaxis protein
MEKPLMNKPSKPVKHVRQRYFVAREIQFTIAILVVLALLGGIFLQSITAAVISYYGIKTPALGIFLIVGYIALVAILAIFFSHRLVGPFKRLEYEMKHIKAGELEKKLSIRTKDDLHVRNFVEQVNDFISNFQDMSREYNKLNSTISKTLGKVIGEMSEEGCDMDNIRKELKSLQDEIHRFREKW